jgi:cell shape-determining protein MreC
MIIRYNRLTWYREMIVLAVFIGITGLGEWLGITDPVRAGIQTVARPIMVVAAGVQRVVLQPVTALNARNATVSRVTELENQLNDAFAKISELEQVEQENQELRQALGAQSRPFRTIIASPITSYGLPTISVGSQQGVIAGNPVLASDTLVGLVEVVSQHQSTVTLLSNSQSSTIVVRTEQGVEGLIRGDGKRIILTEVPQDKELVQGSRIVTAGQQSIPAQLFIGTVGQIISEQSAPVQTVIVEQLMSFYDVPVVEVLP